MSDRPKCPVEKCRAYGTKTVPGFYLCDGGHQFHYRDVEAHARRTDPETSHQAARSMSDERINDMQGKALAALVALGGFGINDEIVGQSGEEWQAITPRMRPLANKRMVREAGKRRSLRTKQRQIVLAITERGRRVHLRHVS